jgi:hypothetical protein
MRRNLTRYYGAGDLHFITCSCWGLVASPELWRWSSFRAYAMGESGLVRVNDWTVLKLKIRPRAV